MVPKPRRKNPAIPFSRRGAIRGRVRDTGPMRQVEHPGLVRRLRRWIGALALASHPEPCAVVTLLVAVLAATAGTGPRTLWVAAAVGSGQLGVGWSNDYVDRERDRASGRTDKPLPGGRVSAPAVRNAAIGGLALTVPLSLAAGRGFAVAHLAAVAAALAYNARLKLLPLSVLPYAFGFGLVPVAVTQAARGSWPAAWAVAAAAVLGAGAHFTQVLPDIGRDRSLGVKGLPQLLGERASALLAAILLLTANLIIAFGPGQPGLLDLALLVAAVAFSAAVVMAAAIGRLRLAFRLTLVVAAAAVAAFLASGRSL
jgi:4-hydroxybenzoate polyprenyltransferase